MTYKKPHNVKYVDMAIYVDANIYSPDCDVDTCFQYLYHLFYMLAYKRKFFQNARDYDEYALYGATQVFLRYKNEKQFQQENPLPIIKSCLNYIKKVMYPLKVNFQQDTFAQMFVDELMAEQNTQALAEDMYSKAANSMSTSLRAEFKYYLKKIAKTAKQVIKDIPYRNDKVMMHNIYLSCILSFLKSVTISNKNKIRLQNKFDRKLHYDNLMETIYAEERTDEVVLFHLDASMGNYISTLVNKIKKHIVEDLKNLIGSNQISGDVIKSILASPMEDYVEDR